MSLPTAFEPPSNNLPTAFEPPSNHLATHTPHTPHPVGAGPTGGLEPPASPDCEESLQRKNPDGTPTASQLQRRSRKGNAKMRIGPEGGTFANAALDAIAGAAP